MQQLYKQPPTWYLSMTASVKSALVTSTSPRRSDPTRCIREKHIVAYVKDIFENHFFTLHVRGMQVLSSAINKLLRVESKRG
jgi:hypothetical protein